jgi:hypothetical protein
MMTRPLDRLPEPAVPIGYHLGSVQTRAEMIGRVHAHQAAFAPSDLTVEK